MDFNPFSLSLIVTGLIALVIAAYIGTHRRALGAGTFALGMASLTVWSIAYGMELASTTLPDMFFWIRIEYLGIATLPALWFVFVIQFSGRGKLLTPFKTFLLFVIPVCTIALVATNQLHHIYFSAISIIPEGSMVLLNLFKGPWYWVHVTYSYILLALGTFILVWDWWESQRPYKDQIELMLAGILVPWIFDITYILGIRPFTHLDPTPFGFLMTGLLVMTGLYWYHFLDLVPIARSRLFEAMQDGVIVIEKSGKIADINHSAAGVMDLQEKKLIGSNAREVFAEYPLLPNLIEKQEDGIVEITTNGKTPRYLEIRSTRVNDGIEGSGSLSGILLILRDISERRQGEIALHTAIEKMKILSGVTRHDINNQIMAMQSYLFLLDNEFQGPPQKEYLKNVLQSSDRIAQWIRFTEEIQRFGFKEPSWYYLRKLADSSWETLRGTGIEIENSINGICIYSDPLIMGIFPRLIRNIQNYGKSVTKIRFSSRFEEGKGCTILCEDNGAGVSLNRKEEIFLRNTQEDPGFSLYLTQEILAISGFTIRETGNPGQGARFEILIPEGSYRRENTKKDLQNGK